VPDEKIVLAQVAETLRRVDAQLTETTRPLSERGAEMLQRARARLQELETRWLQLKVDCADRKDAKVQQMREALAELRREVHAALALLDQVQVGAAV